MDRGKQENVLELMFQSPSVLFSYWHLTLRYLQIFARTLGLSSPPKLVARLLKIGFKDKGNNNGFITIEKIIEMEIEKSGTRYLKGLKEGSFYRFVIGFYLGKNFIILLQSDMVALSCGDPRLKKETLEDSDPENYSFYNFS